MIVATRKSKSHDGELIVVDRDRAMAVSANSVAPSLLAALDQWSEIKPKLQHLADQINSGKAPGSFKIEPTQLRSPLPRTWSWMDGSAYLNHMRLVRKARGAEMPENAATDPLMYQGGSDTMLDPLGDICVASEDYGIDFESEVAVILDNVPMGVAAKDAGKHIQFVMICNDVSLRNLIPDELAKGFGFIHGKPPSAFAPFAVTPDELGNAWKDSKLFLPLETKVNGKFFGNPDAGAEMSFSFAQLIAHAAKTRPLLAGTIIGSGTVSMEDRSRGSSCLAEVRMIEKIETGKSTTPFLKFGDTVTIEMFQNGRSIFGRIHQKVSRA